MRFVGGATGIAVVGLRWGLLWFMRFVGETTGIAVVGLRWGLLWFVRFVGGATGIAVVGLRWGLLWFMRFFGEATGIEMGIVVVCAVCWRDDSDCGQIAVLRSCWWDCFTGIVHGNVVVEMF